MRYGFGIDVGGTTVKLGLFAADGALLEKWEIPTVTEDGGEKILPDIAEAVLNCLKRKDIPRDEVFGIGLGLPGAVRKDGTVNRCINLGWGVRNAEQELRQMTGIPVKAGNDANLAALGEAWRSGCDNLLMITFGTGVGGGIVLDGKPLYGVHGAAGEIGHMTLEPGETRLCACGKRGCAEQYCSAPAIVRMAKEGLEASKEPSLLWKKDLSCKDVFDAAKSGDGLAKAVLDKAFAYMGRFIADACCCIDPERVVLGGGVSKAGDCLPEGIKPWFDKYIFHASNAITFSLAQLGNDAGIYGAGKLAMDTFLN